MKYIKTFESFLNESYLFEAESDSVLQKTEMKDFHGKEVNIETVATLLGLKEADMSKIMKVSGSKAKAQAKALKGADRVEIPEGVNWIDKNGDTDNNFLIVKEKDGQKFVLLYEYDDKKEDEEVVKTVFFKAD